jgi:hypothetical protein
MIFHDFYELQAGSHFISDTLPGNKDRLQKILSNMADHTPIVARRQQTPNFAQFLRGHGCGFSPSQESVNN